MKYKTATTSHEACIQALTEAKLRGEQPSQDLVEREADALRALTTARQELLAAMALAPGD